MQLPRITVVTPNYNQSRFIEATIHSVISQGYPNLEYIIIDGGSTDGSVDIIKKYEKQLAYWVSESDIGQYHAVQKGLSKATGEIMTYINSDDILAPGSLYTAAQIFSDYPQIQWLGGITNHIDEHGRIVSIGIQDKWNKYRYLNFDFKYIQQEGIFWSKSLWDKAGGYISTQYTLASDLELWSRFFQYAELYSVPGVLGSFRIRSHNQRSLEGISLYGEEAKTILSNLKKTSAEESVLSITRSLLYRALGKKQLRFLFILFGYNKIYQLVNKYPADIIFDRVKQKFIIE